MTFAVAKRLLAAAAIGLLFFAGAAGAQSSKTPDTSDMPPILAKAVKAGQLKVTKQFDTDVPGLTGFVVEKGGQYQIVYGEHGYMIMGNVVSPDGDNLSSEYTDKYVPKPDVAKVVDQLKATGHLVQQGPDDAPVIYAFADPNCIFCHTFYQRAKPLVDAGKLQVQWVLVGFLKPSSIGRAAAILSADHPAKALAENEKGFDEDSENGGIDPLDDPSGALKKAINTHYKQMAAAGGTGTPTLLYRKDGQWTVKVGAPTKSWIKNYVGNHS